MPVIVGKTIIHSKYCNISKIMRGLPQTSVLGRAYCLSSFISNDMRQGLYQLLNSFLLVSRVLLRFENSKETECQLNNGFSIALRWFSNNKNKY